METKRLFDEDVMQKECEAEVVRTEPYHGGFAVVLDQTVFFPEGGGQLSDTGTLTAAGKALAVTHVHEKAGEIFHETKEPLEPGTKVQAKLDWTVRFDHMQQHCGEHMLSYAFYKLFGAHNVGFHMSADMVGIDLDKEARRLEKERRSQFPELTTCLFRVTNPAVFDRSLMQINARAMTGAVISRHKHNEQIAIPTAQTILHEGDYIQAVGSEEALNQLAVLVGEREEGELPLVDMQEIESLLLTKKDMINKQLGDLNLMKNFGCTVTRIRRSGIDLSPSPDLALKFGDKLMVVGEKDGIKGVARLLGNDTKQLSDTDFFPIALGIVLGVLFGILGSLLGDLVGKSLNSHCDTHIDPPATTIFILTIVINAVSSVINA